MIRLLRTKCNQTLIPKSYYPHLHTSYNIIRITNFSSSSKTSSISLLKQQKTSSIEDFLINSGLKPSKKPISVVKFFKSFGFSDTQIKTIITKCSPLFFFDVAKILKPKIEFFQSIGLSEQDVIKMVILYPYVLWRSLHDAIIPSFDLLKHYCGGQKIAADKIKQWPALLAGMTCECLAPNVKTLRDVGVPETRVAKMVTGLSSRGTCAYTKPSYFRKVVTAVLDMGFDPSSLVFQEAVHTMAWHTERGWLKKLNMYKSLGFSEGEIHYMFKKQPKSLCLSEKKLRAAVKFYFEKCSWSPSGLMMKPNALMYSLDKRVVPRCSVLQVLVLNNKVKNVNIISLLVKTDNEFLEKYVNSYKDEIPDVVDAYEGKIKFDDFNFDLT